MQILTDINNVVAFTGTIEKGIFDADKSRELYKITNDNGVFYAVTEFNLFDVDALPDDFEEMKYCYTEEDGFFLNPNRPIEDNSLTIAGFDSAKTYVAGDLFAHNGTTYTVKASTIKGVEPPNSFYYEAVDLLEIIKNLSIQEVSD